MVSEVLRAGARAGSEEEACGSGVSSEGECKGGASGGVSGVPDGREGAARGVRELRGKDERRAGGAMFGMFPERGAAGGEEVGVGADEEELMGEVEELKGELERLRREGVMDDEVDGAYWMLGQGRGLEYAREVVGRYLGARRVKLSVETKGISREEHDALLGRAAPRGVDREEYERLMREMQGG